MNIHRTFCKGILAAVFVLAGTGSLRAATLLVNWGGNYVASNQATGRTIDSTTSTASTWNVGDATDDGVRGGAGAAFNSSTALNPSSGYSGTSSTFYGGVSGGRVSSTGSNAFENIGFNVLDGGSGDRIAFALSTNSRVQNFRAASGLLFWEKSDFLNGGDALTLSLQDLSLSMNVTAVQKDVGEFRVFLKNGSTYYYSELISGFDAVVGLQSLTGATLASANFYAVALTDGSFNNNLMNTNVGTAVLGSTLSDITALGFTFNTGATPITTTSDYTIQAGLEISSVEFSVIPEPSAFILFGTGLFILLVRRRRLSA